MKILFTILLLVTISQICKSQRISKLLPNDTTRTYAGIGLIEISCAVAHYDSVGRSYSCDYGSKRFYSDTTIHYTPAEWAKLIADFHNRMTGESNRKRRKQ